MILLLMHTEPQSEWSTDLNGCIEKSLDSTPYSTNLLTYSITKTEAEISINESSIVGIHVNVSKYYQVRRTPQGT